MAPEDNAVARAIAETLLKKGDDAEAARTLQEVVQREPRRGFTHDQLAHALEKTGRLEESTRAARGLDVYVGTLSRYYAGNWQTIVQQSTGATVIGAPRDDGRWTAGGHGHHGGENPSHARAPKEFAVTRLILYHFSAAAGYLVRPRTTVDQAAGERGGPAPSRQAWLVLRR